MDRTELLARVQAARGRTGTLTPAALRDEALAGFGAEVADEQATTLGRLGRRLDDALARMREIASSEAPDAAGYAALRRDFLEARWEMTVVREAMGLRGVRRELDEFWPIPAPLRA